MTTSEITTLKPFQDTPSHIHGSASGDDESDCAICNRPVKIGPRRKWLHVVAGGEEFACKDAPKDEYGDLGWWPVGPTCWKNHKATIEALNLDVSTTVEIYGT